jgi:putative acetyltransferase
MALWRRSVTDTHTFLTEEDIRGIERDLADFLPNLEVWVFELDGRPVGFMGLSRSKVEMLFVETGFYGRRIGTLLLNHARSRHETLVLDVNEQNPLARDFYLRYGFRETGRSVTDAAGRPFPLIHMRLDAAGN